jgi:hypothetical protein
MIRDQCCPPATCWEDIGVFERDEGNGNVSRLVGRRGSPGHVYRHLEIMNEFEASESLVPEGFREVHRDYDYWARTYIWNPDKHRLIPRTPPHPEAVGQLFFPNENGGRDFAVYVQPTLEGGRIEDGVARVSVLRVPRDRYLHRDDDHRDPSLSWQLPSASWYQELALSLERPERVWVSHDFAEGQHGCSILVHDHADRYVLLCGSHLVEFASPEPVLKSFSNLGNNDVPYPVALTASRVLLLLDMVWLPRSVFASPPLSLLSDEDWAGAYSLFYDWEYRTDSGDRLDALALPLDGVRKLES